MSVTDKLIQLDPTLKVHGEGEWDKDIFKKPNYTSFNDAGLECETGELLYGFVKVLQPDRVLETGTHFGVGASYMGMALKDNFKGVLDTIEFLPEIYNVAKARVARLELEEYVKCHLGDVAQFDPMYSGDTRQYDMILLDTEPQTRFAELIKFYPYLKPGGYVFIHDLHRHLHQIPNSEHGFAWPYGPLPEEIKKWVRNGELRPFHFGTPRGLTGFYKVDTKNDYDWR